MHSFKVLVVQLFDSLECVQHAGTSDISWHPPSVTSLHQINLFANSDVVPVKLKKKLTLNEKK